MAETFPNQLFLLGECSKRQRVGSGEVKHGVCEQALPWTCSWGRPRDDSGEYMKGIERRWSDFSNDILACLVIDENLKVYFEKFAKVR